MTTFNWEDFGSVEVVNNQAGCHASSTCFPLIFTFSFSMNDSTSLAMLICPPGLFVSGEWNGRGFRLAGLDFSEDNIEIFLFSPQFSTTKEFSLLAYPFETKVKSSHTCFIFLPQTLQKASERFTEFSTFIPIRLWQSPHATAKLSCFDEG